MNKRSRRVALAPLHLHHQQQKTDTAPAPRLSSSSSCNKTTATHKRILNQRLLLQQQQKKKKPNNITTTNNILTANTPLSYHTQDNSNDTNIVAANTPLSSHTQDNSNDTTTTHSSSSQQRPTKRRKTNNLSDAAAHINTHTSTTRTQTNSQENAPQPNSSSSNSSRHQHHQQQQTAEAPGDAASADDEATTRANNNENTQQHLQRQQQILLPSASYLGASERDAIFMRMRQRELCHRTYMPHAKYIKCRRIIVDWMCEVSEEFELSSITTHMAVRHLDRLLSTVSIAKQKLQLAAMTCIFVSAKYEEMQQFVPLVSDLNSCSNNAYTRAEILDMEGVVLRALDWTLGVITPIHFVRFFLDRDIIFEGDFVVGRQFSRARLLRYLLSYVDFFCDISLQEYRFCRFLPSVLAAGILACARRAVNLAMVWPEELCSLTGYSADEVYECHNCIFKYYEQSFPASVPAAVSPADVANVKFC